MLRLRRQLVRKLRPFLFDNDTHLIGDVVDALDFEHVFVQPLQVGRHHDLTGDDAWLIFAGALSHSA